MTKPHGQRQTWKYVRKSDIYKNVYLMKDSKGFEFWTWKIQGSTVKGKVSRQGKTADSERDAALAVDKFLISVGKQPVNVLKPR